MKNLTQLKEIETELNNADKIEAFLDCENNQLVVKNETEFTSLVSHRFLLHNAADMFKHKGDEIRGEQVLSFYEILD